MRIDLRCISNLALHEMRDCIILDHIIGRCDEPFETLWQIVLSTRNPINFSSKIRLRVPPLYLNGARFCSDEGTFIDNNLMSSLLSPFAGKGA